MGVGVGSRYEAVVRWSMDGFVVPPVSRASSYGALWHPGYPLDLENIKDLFAFTKDHSIPNNLSPQNGCTYPDSTF